MKEWIRKLQNLPETKKIIIFFTVMGICALIAGFVGMRIMIHDFAKIKDFGKNISLPSIEIPDELKNLGNEFQATTNLDATNTSPGDQQIIN